ncbi:hypothetical protein M9434_004152 [Picochlorum sp. BPE23]|nr:hypothetical protein M9434_004152 [Picochlorum sp. BPE23]
MVRKKQAKPVSKKRVLEGGFALGGESSPQQRKKGLVDSIWEAAQMDEQEYEKGLKKTKVVKDVAQNGGEWHECCVHESIGGDFPFLFALLEMDVGVSSIQDVDVYGLGTGDRVWNVRLDDASSDQTTKGSLVMETDIGSNSCRLTMSQERQCSCSESLLRLIKSDHISLGPIMMVPGGATGCGACRLGISVTQKAFQGLSTYPGDARGKPKSHAMLDVLRGMNCVSDTTQDGTVGEDGFRDPIIVASSNSSTEGAELDASGLFDLIKPRGDEIEYSNPIPVLKPTLHGYQKRVLHWMIQREKSPGSFCGALSHDGEHVLWKSVPCLKIADDQRTFVKDEGAAFCVNAFTGMLRMEPMVNQVGPRGGIACDEMGLGKTVEMLALIAANPAPKSNTNIEEAYPSVFEKKEEDDIKEIFCMCGVFETMVGFDVNSPPLVECNRCNVWSHAACVGMRDIVAQQQWVCNKCRSEELMETEILESNATLVVCPVSILSQWEGEIEKHVIPGSLKVMKYLGQEQPWSSKESAIVSPQDLAVADIVLTTYDVLRQDLYRNPDRTEGRSLRYEKRYHIMPTPLTRVKFWRVVVDEAQMVESSTAKATEMVMKIAATNLWCVTGTPISRGLEDLYGLFSFLRVDPYAQKGWWARLIQSPLESVEHGQSYQEALTRLVKLLKPSLGGLMWRSSKKDVSTELKIPPQRECLHRLDLSRIERHFYQRQHQACCGAAQKTLPKSVGGPKKVHTLGDTNPPANAGIKDRFLTKKEERKLLLPLLRLRQACVHPQVGAGGLKSLAHIKTPMSMIQVLETMINKAKIEAEDAQRLFLSTHNGLAGLKVLQENFADAATHYREVLKVSQENEQFIKADKLQILHTVYNLVQILDKPGVGRSLQDDNLKSSIASLQKGYMAEPKTRLALAENELKDLSRDSKAIHKKFSQECSAAKDVMSYWWAEALLLLKEADKHEEFVQDLKEYLTQDEVYRHAASKNASNIASRFSDIFGLQVLLGQELGAQDEMRSEVVALLEYLGKRVSEEDPGLIDAAAHCGTCRSFNATGGIVCEHCHFDRKMIGWEVRLFTLVASARGKGTLSAENIAEAAHKQSLYRVGIGGVGEKSSLQGDGVQGKRSDNKVADSKVIRGPSQTEKVLKYLANFIKSISLRKEDSDEKRQFLLKAAKYHLDLMELRRREFIKVRALAVAQRQVLYSLDELNMCRMRMRLRLSTEHALSAEEERYTVHPFEIPERLVEFQTEHAIAQNDLQNALGTWKYLKSLEKLNSTHGTSNGDAPVKEQICPVCHDVVGHDLAMPPCGHVLCIPCNDIIVGKESKSRNERTMKCPTCRAVSPASETAVVTSTVPEGRTVVDGAWEGEEKIQVNGSFGSKIESIVRRVKIISESLPEDKMIIFSSWKDALDIVAFALEQNGVHHLYPKTGKKFDQAVSVFRNSNVHDSPRVLLLLLKQGGNGLNLQQAQHVVFVEPVLDPGEEAQAIGRVDRMGQKKQTFVHKFIVRESIEENVARISEQKKLSDGMKSRHNSQSKHHLSLGEVTALLN